MLVKLCLSGDATSTLLAVKEVFSTTLSADATLIAVKLLLGGVVIKQVTLDAEVGAETHLACDAPLAYQLFQRASKALYILGLFVNLVCTWQVVLFNCDDLPLSNL